MKRLALLLLLAGCSSPTEPPKRKCWTTTVTVEFVTPDSLTWEQADSVTLEDCADA